MGIIYPSAGKSAELQQRGGLDILRLSPRHDFSHAFSPVEFAPGFFFLLTICILAAMSTLQSVVGGAR